MKCSSGTCKEVNNQSVRLQALGVDLATIQSIVGHASEDMTKHYLHVQDSIKEEAVQRFAAAFHVDETHWTE